MKNLRLNSLISEELREQEMAQAIGAADVSVCQSGYCGTEENAWKTPSEIYPEKGTAITSPK